MLATVLLRSYSISVIHLESDTHGADSPVRFSSGNTNYLRTVIKFLKTDCQYVFMNSEVDF